MSWKEHHNKYCQNISPFRIGVFCHKCGKDNFGGNTKSLSSHVWYCKPNKITTQSNLTRRNQQYTVALLLHDSGTDLFLFLVRKRKDPPQSVHHVQPKSKEGHIVSRGASSTTSSSILCEDPSDVIDVDLNTTNHEVTDHESYQAGIVDTSLIPSKESEIPFDLEAPMPRNTQFQLDLLNVLSQHHTDLKVHDQIISVIKRHSNDQSLTFSSRNPKSRSSLLKDLK